MYHAASEASPEEAAPWLGVGVSALRGGADPRLALGALQRAAALQPNHPQIATALAVGLFFVGRTPDARALAERAAQLDPSDQDARAVRDLLRELGGER